MISVEIIVTDDEQNTYTQVIHIRNAGNRAWFMTADGQIEVMVIDRRKEPSRYSHQEITWGGGI